MITVITNKEDVTSDLIVLELRKRHLNYLRLNTEEMDRYRISFELGPNGPTWGLCHKGKKLSSAAISACYYRRPKLPNFMGSDYSAYRTSEWLALRDNFFQHLDGRWFSSPASILAAENKLHQLEIAWKLGFEIPYTLAAANAELLAANSSRRFVVKPLRTSQVSVGGVPHVIFTSRVTDLSVSQSDTAQLAPFITQEEVAKRFDIRVTVVACKVFATEIHSQLFPDTETDWRRGSNPDLPHIAHMLPESVQEKCINLVSTLNLRFGAIDLVQDSNGKYWFLEINPNGQWGWIERRTGAPISSAIVDELVAISHKWGHAQ